MLTNGDLTYYINKIKEFDSQELLIEKYRLEYILRHYDVLIDEAYEEEKFNDKHYLEMEREHFRDFLTVLNEVCEIKKDVTLWGLDLALTKLRATQPEISDNHYYCPTCHCLLSRGAEFKHCTECGQKLDWNVR